MSTAELLIGQMAGENEIDPVLFRPDQHSLSQFPQAGIHGDGTPDALFYPLSGLSGEHKGYQLERSDGSLYSFDTSLLLPPTELNPAASTSASSSNFVSQTPASSVLSAEDGSDKPKKTPPPKRKKSSTIIKSAKKKTPTETPAKAVPKTRTQPRRGATKTSNNTIEVQTEENKPKHRRQRSLEKNRVAASKCRKRKKQWTENLEQKKSGLESVHAELQSEYMELLQETSELKNFLISHASCQDPNIDIWIKNEASKYVRNLDNASLVNSIHSLPSQDGDAFTSRHASIPSAMGGLSRESTDRETEDPNSGETEDEEGAFEGDLED
ncbi:activating transcription factor 7a [Metarhizium anisopliae]